MGRVGLVEWVGTRQAVTAQEMLARDWGVRILTTELLVVLARCGGMVGRRVDPWSGG
jgi:hypothetical protein